MRTTVSLHARRAAPARMVRVPQAELVLLYRRLAVLVETGVSIDRALKFLASSGEGVMAQVLDLLQGKVAQGEDLGAVMNSPQLAKVFSPLARGLIATGMKTGALAESLSRLADVTERRYSQKRAFISALSYPAAISVAIALLALLFLIFIAPGEMGIYASLGAELPWPTWVLIEISRLVSNPALWGVLSLVVIAGFPLLKHCLHPSGRFRLILDGKMLKVPFFGTLWEKAAASQVLHIWNCSLGVGMPLGEGIALSLPTVTNREILRRLQLANQDLRDGADFGDALKRHMVFPQLVTSMISLGFESGQLDSMLERVSKMYDEDVDNALSQLAKVIEPVLLGVGGVMAGFVALACLLPMLQLSSAL